MNVDLMKNIIKKLVTAQEAFVYLQTHSIEEHENLLKDIEVVLDVCFKQLGKNMPNDSPLKTEQLIESVGKIRTKYDLDIVKNEFEEVYEAILKNCMVDKFQEKSMDYCIINGVDREFYHYVELIKKMTFEELCQNTLGYLQKIKEENNVLYQELTVKYQGWYFEDNVLEGIGGNNTLILNRMKVLKERIDDLQWFYKRLGDYRSKSTLNAIINNWLTFAVEPLRKVGDGTFPSNFDLDIIHYQPDEVFVDAGAYIGDTVADFYNTCGGQYKRIYTYEISMETFKILENNLKSIPNIINNCKGVSDKQGKLFLRGAVDAPFHGNKLENEGLYGVDVVSLDDDIKEDISFLKIDVEGVDKEALVGAKKHIQRTHPKIVVDSYHKLADIVDIPLLINQMEPNYTFYIRYPVQDISFATAYCIYAI